MNKKYIKWLGGTLMGTAIVAGLSSCSDDHFNVNPDVAGRSSLWQNIESNEELSEFADILKRVRYSKSEGSVTPQTYADLLDHDQTFTVWAPKNGTFDYQYYDKLLKDGTVGSEYTVEKELIRNNLTRYSYVMSGADSLNIELFNSKTAMFNCAKATIKNSRIVQPNIGASNGVLHIVDEPISYQPNLYEYMATMPELDSLNTFVKKYEIMDFNENASTQGPTVDGQITWVDSVMYVNNEYLSQINAYINSEDSCYAMIMPTNEAWKQALAMSEKYFKFRDSYTQTVVTENPDGTTSTVSKNTSFTPEQLDSLTELYTKNAITQNLVFNANYQYGYSYKDFAVPGACDSLTSTVQEDYISSNTAFYAPECSELFDGAEPVTLSNGYAYIVNNFNFKPNLSWAYDKEISALSRNVETYSKCSLAPSSVDYQYTVTDENGEVVLDTLASYILVKTIQQSSSSNPEVTFKIPNTLSCKYDIYVLMAYNTEANKPTKFRAQLSYHTESKATVTTTTLSVPAGGHGSGTSFENVAPHLDENGNFQIIDSVLLAKDFEFPVAYMGLNDAYVTLKLVCYVGSRETTQYTREMWIDKIIFKAKDE
ncbi:MAG: fasciclin domain-containing protein [Bacteroides sp.]|nr:fasciclin domain-containing protein [Roseburia sp.]MCM1346202.1 fasciclin domain-containing protein [Bacteroides sp.]MCM1419971.1 fasciclin domain-containing protein [Bacteroides sp.]